tara:strand:+ start:1918 stop:2157 length:240 start_codon:yes stop_codon:yes gene_type:complete
MDKATGHFLQPGCNGLSFAADGGRLKMQRLAIHYLCAILRITILASIFLGPIAAIAANHVGQDRTEPGALGLVLYFSLR